MGRDGVCVIAQGEAVDNININDVSNRDLDLRCRGGCEELSFDHFPLETGTKVSSSRDLGE